jgi:hypothetical protein
MTEHAMAQLRIVHYLNRFSVAKFVSVYVRLALGTAFLSAVADRFGLWGPPGARNVS